MPFFVFVNQDGYQKATTRKMNAVSADVSSKHPGSANIKVHAFAKKAAKATVVLAA